MSILSIILLVFWGLGFGCDIGSYRSHENGNPFLTVLVLALVFFFYLIDVVFQEFCGPENRERGMWQMAGLKRPALFSLPVSAAQ